MSTLHRILRTQYPAWYARGETPFRIAETGPYLSEKAARGMLEQHGNALWEWICDTASDRFFRVTDLAHELQKQTGLSYSTCRNYISTVLYAVAAQYKETPDDCPFYRDRKTYVWR